MKNKCYLDGVLIVKSEYIKPHAYFVLETGKQIKRPSESLLKNKQHVFEVECNFCKNKWSRTTYWHACNTFFKCLKCNAQGENNAFYGKKHTEEYKKRSSARMKEKYADPKNNPFYGKHHSEKTKKILSEKLTGKLAGELNPFYGKHHSEQTKKILREKSYLHSQIPEVKEATRQRFLNYLSTKKYGVTTIERAVWEYLKEKQVNFTYNFIKFGFQYDFVIQEHKIIIEVQGDYWHANPNKYGEGKKPLNDRQKFKVERDQQKRKLAEENEYKILYIWEYNIRKQDFSALSELLCLKNTN